MRPLLEKVSSPSHRSFHAFDYVRPVFECPLHFHPECELTHIVASRGLRFTGDHIDRFGPGDLVLFGPNLPHSYTNDPPTRRRGQPAAHSRVIQFASDSLGGLLQLAPEFAPIRRLLDRAARGLRFTGAARSAALALLDAFFAAPAPDRIPIFLQILLRLARSRDAQALAGESYRAHTPSLGEDVRIGRVCAHLNRHFAQPIYLAQAAKLAHLSTSAFCRFFRRSTGKTFTAFVNEVRLSHACRMLQEETLGITEICFRCGFDNVANFNRQFRRLHAMSPGEYRRRHQAFDPTLGGPTFRPAGPAPTGPRRTSARAGR